MSSKPKYDLEYFKNIIESKGGELLSTNYRILSDILKVRCGEGHEWEVEAHSIHNDHWCWDCFCSTQRIPFDEDFFSRDNEESFYVAGFLAADGWKGRTSNSFLQGIQLSVKDDEHLVNIKNLLKYEGEIKYSIKKTTYNAKWNNWKRK